MAGLLGSRGAGACRLLAAAGVLVLLQLPLASGAQAATPPTLSVTGAALIEASTGQQLYGVNATRELPIASTTKLMTALITLQQARLAAVVAAPDYKLAASDSQIGLQPGERMSVRDLLVAMLLPSADDAAEDLAYNIGGRSIPRFIAAMNREANLLGLTETHYTTPIGLDTPGNYSSPLNLVQLAAYLLRTEPFFRQVVARPSAVLTTGARRRAVTNRNDLVGRYAWINGVKTGHTLDAGYVLVASGTSGGMTLIGAVLGTSSEQARDADALALLDYGFANFRLLRPVLAGSTLATPTVRDQPGKRAQVIAGRSYTHVFARSVPVTLRVQAPRQLAGPLRENAVVGSVVVLAGGHPVAKVPLLLAHRLSAVSTLTLIGRFLTRPSTLVGLVLVVALAIGAAMFLRERSRERAAAGPEPA